jgi:hypothetical protein
MDHYKNFIHISSTAIIFKKPFILIYKIHYKYSPHNDNDIMDMYFKSIFIDNPNENNVHKVSRVYLHAVVFGIIVGRTIFSLDFVFFFQSFLINI